MLILANIIIMHVSMHFIFTKKKRRQTSFLILLSLCLNVKREYIKGKKRRNIFEANVVRKEKR